MNEIITVSQAEIGVEMVNTVNARELHSFLGVKSRYNDWFANRVEQYGFTENQDFVTLTINLVSGGKQADHHLTIDMAKELSMVERNEKGKQARQYFIECEKVAKQHHLAIPNFNNPALAARAWAEQYERAQIAEATKAQIGERREATAMNTASQAVKKANKLEQQLDYLKQYCTVKRMSMINHGIQFNWRELRSASAIMNLPAIDVFDQNYGTVKAYHRDVWQEVYAVSSESEALV